MPSTAPGIHVLTRRPAELETLLAEEVRAARGADPLEPLTILVGGTLLRPYLRRRIAELTGGHAGLRIVTAGELARGLGAGPLRAAGRTALAPLVARAIAREVSDSAGGYLRPVAGARGLADSLGRLFAELRGAGIGPGELRALLDDHGPAGEKHAELATLYARDEELRAPFFGTEECLRGADPVRLEGSRLLVHGLWSAPALLLDLLAGIAARIPVVVLLPQAPVAEAACGELVELLRVRGATVDSLDRDESVAGEPDPPPRDALEHVQRNLFADTGRATGAAPADATLRLCSAPDAEREVRTAARACLAWAAEGIGFHEMAVAYRHDGQYPRLIESAFGEAGIPVHLPRGAPLSERPLGRRALAFLKLLDSGFERGVVMRFLAEDPLPHATRDAYGGASVAAWDRESREAGVVAGVEQWSERLESHAAEVRAGSGEPERIDARVQAIEGLARLVADIAAASQQWPARASWSDHAGRLASLVARYVDGAEPVAGALAPLVELDRLGRDTTRERFLGFAAEALREAAWDRRLDGVDTGFGRRGVVALDVNALRHLRFRAVVVLGLVERAFPPPPRQDALLLDEERERLRACGHPELPLRARGSDPEPLQFSLAASAAMERLALSYARTEAGTAGVRLPSSFFRATVEALLGRRVEVEEVGKLLREGGPSLEWIGARELGPPPGAPALTLAERDRGRLGSSDPSLVRITRAVLEHERPSLRRAAAAERARMAPELGPYDGVLAAPVAEALTSDGQLSQPRSPTSLETYAECPYRFLLGRLLRLQPVTEPEALERIAPTDRGKLVHAVLQRFLESLPEGERPSPERRAEHLRTLAAIYTELCDHEEARGATGLPLLWRYERNTLHEDLETWYDAEADAGDAPFTRSAFELGFGPQRGDEPASPLSSDEPLELDAGGRRLRFAGRIDRVDWREGPEPGFRVVDYKTGRVRRTHREDKLHGGRSLQLPLYLLAAAERLGLDVRHGRAEYFYVSRRGGFQRVGFSGAALAERRDRFDELLARLTESIGAGAFQQAPSAENCRYCDFNTLCDARRVETAARKSGDPRAQAFAALGEDFDAL